MNRRWLSRLRRSGRDSVFMVSVLLAPLGFAVPVLSNAADPGRPRDLTAEVLGPTSVRLSWKEGKDGSETEFYFVYRNGEPVAAVDEGDEDEWVDEDLTPWTEYTYYVVAFDGRGRQSSPSDEQSVRTPDATPPGPPGDLEAEAKGPFAVVLAWTAAEDPESGIANYVVIRDGERLSEAVETSWTDESVRPESEYRYRVRAVNGSGDTGESTDAALVVTPPAPDTTPPAPPAGLRIVQP